MNYFTLKIPKAFRGWLCLRFGGQRVEKETLLFKHWRLQGLLFLGGVDEKQEQSSPLCGSDGHTPAHSSLCSAHRDRCCRAPHWRTGQERNAQLFKNHQQLTSTFYSTNKVTNFNQVYWSFCTQNKRGNYFFFPRIILCLAQINTSIKTEENLHHRPAFSIWLWE